jgi:hypothetical protein
MSSSISPFSRLSQRPGFVTFVIAAAAFLSMAAGVFYTVELNPEIRVIKAGARIKQTWARHLSQDYTNKVIVFGGSSCNFSIDPEFALKQGRPVANMGLYAAMGATVTARFALEQARPGDTLVVSVEPPLLEHGALEPPDKTSRTHIHFAWALGAPRWLEPGLNLDTKSIPWKTLLYLPPSSEHLFVLASKIVRRQPLYKHKIENFTSAGQQFDDSPMVYTGPALPGRVDRAYFEALKAECKRRQLRLAYLLPWQYAPPAIEEGLRATNAAFLQQVAALVPVLEETNLGVYTNKAGMGDYLFHLNRDGARERTRSFLRALEVQERKWMADATSAPR